MPWDRLIITAALSLFVAVPLLLAPGVGFAQGADELAALRQEIEGLKAGQAAIQGQLKAIQALLQRGGGQGGRPPPTEAVDLVLRGAGDDPVKGDAEAALVLVEYSDYQCPFCRRHFMSTMPQLDREYLQSGKVRYVFRDLPIESIHPFAVKAAEAANCAGDQGQYWAMHDRLFQNSGELAPEQLPGHAQAIGLDMAAFTGCLDSAKHEDEVRQDMADGASAGIRGTPTFFLAVQGDEPDTLKTLVRIRGAQPFSVFKTAIDAILTGQAKAAEAG